MTNSSKQTLFCHRIPLTPEVMFYLSKVSIYLGFTGGRVHSTVFQHIKSVPHENSHCLVGNVDSYRQMVQITDVLIFRLFVCHSEMLTASIPERVHYEHQLNSLDCIVTHVLIAFFHFVDSKHTLFVSAPFEIDCKIKPNQNPKISQQFNPPYHLDVS